MSKVEIRAKLAQEYKNYKPKTPDPDLKRDLKSGWMLPYLLQVEGLLWGRWEYWSDLCNVEFLPKEPIPQIHFGVSANRFDSSCGLRMLERCFNYVSPAWRGWGTSTYLEYFLDWFLWSVGQTKNEPTPPVGAENANLLLYQAFDLWPMLLEPYDYFGNILAESNFGRGISFYPTPHNVVEMMVQMQFPVGDNRLLTVNDPCNGTGRMLLHASNHSLCLYGQDINGLVCKAAEVNGWLYAPWLVKPLNHLKPEKKEVLIDWGDTDTGNSKPDGSELIIWD